MNVPLDLNKLSDVLKNDVVKKVIYDKLVAKVNSVDTRAFLKYDTNKIELEKEITNATGFVKKKKKKIHWITEQNSGC